MSKKVLLVTPRFPIPSAGACEQDRLEGIKQLKRLGYEVHVISKVFDFQDREKINSFSEKFDIPIHLVPYRYLRNTKGLKKIIRLVKRIFWPPYWDGSSFEYTDPAIQSSFREQIENWKPDAVWFDYTYLWPLYNIARKKNIPVITRSINFEAVHFLEEDGRNIINYLKFIPKFITEYITCKKSDTYFSITPKEKKLYKKVCRKKGIINLPLRSMPKILNDESVELKDSNVLQVLFMGSTYNVSHNRKALEFILKEIAPRVKEVTDKKYVFNIFGGKVPEELVKYESENIVFRGYVDDFLLELNKIDIAIVPSLYGAGMQQKIFESLARGLPTIASPRGIADYPFENNVHLLTATTVNDFVKALISMQNFSLREKLAKNAKDLSHKMFSRKEIDDIVLLGLNRIMK